VRQRDRTHGGTSSGCPHVHTMTSSISIRRARPEDAAALTAFASSIFAETFGPDNAPEDMASYLADAFSVERQAAEIADDQGLVLLVEVLTASSLRLIGYAHLLAEPPPPDVGDPDAWELRRFYIAAEWQGRGLAHDLMQEVLRSAASIGAQTIWLGVWEHNPRAIAFYRKHGFREVGSHPFLLGKDAQTDIIMARGLDDDAPSVM
jgi:diamine N-acetyltransferase